jgi:hypothetical protein
MLKLGIRIFFIIICLNLKEFGQVVVGREML